MSVLWTGLDYDRVGNLNLLNATLTLTVIVLALGHFLLFPTEMSTSNGVDGIVLF